MHRRRLIRPGKHWRTAAVATGCVVIALVWGVGRMSMPGRSYHDSVPSLDAADAALRASLKAHVEMLAGDIGERNTLRPDRLSAAAAYIEQQLGAATYDVHRLVYDVDGIECANLVVERPGRERSGEIVIIGAHYDSAPGTPGANDNGTGVAALIELARSFASAEPARTLRFVAFVNEEPPYFQTEDMGSLRYAKQCRQRGEKVAAMVSLETIGYFRDEPGSQRYPFPFGLLYPDRGNFIGFVGNLRYAGLVRETVKHFRRGARIPSEGATIPGAVPGAGWSDHWSFWQAGYPAVMVTDTALFRYPYYHSPRDTPDKIDYDRFTLVVTGLVPVIRGLARM